ncbi:hypothetical protein [Dyella sp. ASV21]|jgi:hypothetical protein|uniref:hypothetical protein n=1 Tax=Dyella sp. ASV21 TaxID=2795114 RepID=UPI0018EB7CCA|nr:hypothetical protein [Dyella sp. ASV21]
MFGWLAHAFASVRPFSAAVDVDISRCTVAMRGDELAACLPLLGSVLCLPAPRGAHETAPLPPGWLVERRELAPLLHTHELMVSSMIGADGPREWIDAMDAGGHLCARLHLLPDTDYLAWDALLVRSRALPSAPLSAQRLACRATHAELLHFRVRRIGVLNLLESAPPQTLSPLGRGIAHEVARTAAVALATG